MVVGVCLAIAVGPYVFSRAMSPYVAVRTYSIELSDSASVPEPLDKSPLRICCFNIAHGRGLVTGNMQGGGRIERRQRLIEIAGLLKQIDADIVVLNEVDFDSTWSFGENQSRFLATESGYPYITEQRNLDFRFVIGSWRFGNAILSRHPILKAELIDFPSLKKWEAILAGKKKSVICEIASGNEVISVAAVHLSHRSEALRVRSAQMLLDASKEASGAVILAGDFNSTPAGFPGYALSASGRNAMDELGRAERFIRRPEVAPSPREFTFRADDPQRTIDWILVSKDLKFASYEAIDTDLSDHRPVVATIEAAFE